MSQFGGWPEPGPSDHTPRQARWRATRSFGWIATLLESGHVAASPGASHGWNARTASWGASESRIEVLLSVVSWDRVSAFFMGEA
jgi:hypothetical protein